MKSLEQQTGTELIQDIKKQAVGDLCLPLTPWIRSRTAIRVADPDPYRYSASLSPHPDNI